jgi:tetratricopeptide (TPR) repeat protein
MVMVFPLLALFLTANSSPQRPPQKSFDEIAKQAEVARTADRMDEAIVLYSEGLRLRPSWSDGWWSLGSLLYDQDRFPEAKEAFKRFVATTPKPGPAYAFLALCEYETREYDKSLQHFQAWGRKGSSGTGELIDVAGFHWALLLTQEGRFPEALYLLAAKAQKVGRSPALVEAMGLASLRMTNLPEDYPSEKRELVWLAGEAAFYSAVGQHDREEECAAKLLMHYSQEPNVHYFRGTLFGFQKERAEAAREYQEELKLSPQHVPAMVELALVQIDDFKPAEAAPLAGRAVALDPKNYRAHYALGRALFETERFQESADHLETAKQLAPDSAPIRFVLAKAYRALGRTKEGERESAAFLSLRGKEEISAPPQGKTALPEQPGPPK